MPREKDDAQLFFKAPAKPLQGLFLTRRDHRLDADARSRTKTFPNLASFGACRRKKFPNSNPAANSAPRPLNSRNFPFAIQSFKHRQVYAAGRKNKSRRDARGVFGIRKRSRRLYKRERQSPFTSLSPNLRGRISALRRPALRGVPCCWRRFSRARTRLSRGPARLPSSFRRSGRGGRL